MTTRGFHRRRDTTPGDRLPPGQYLERGFPVLSAGPTPDVSLDEWTFRIAGAVSEEREWSWEEFQALEKDAPTVDIHCVTTWSKFDTSWEGVSVDTLLEGIEPLGGYVTAFSDGGYTTNLPVEDITGGRAWVVYGYEGDDLEPEHGGPARLLVPHLYFWKSAKWVRGLYFTEEDDPGFWETLGYHDRGDPWLEQRYQGD
jgi:DMSO/TMAO reductase YedYZ molybdopterin-dependent catalytic subunit